MKIQLKNLFHGAATNQIVEHPQFKALNKADAKYGHYAINSDIRILLKITKKDNPVWRFTFQPDDLKTLQDDLAKGFRTFVVLVCGSTTICLLQQADLPLLLDFKAKKAQGVVVEPWDRSLRARSKRAILNRKIRHSDFPNRIFLNARQVSSARKATRRRSLKPCAPAQPCEGEPPLPPLLPFPELVGPLQHDARSFLCFPLPSPLWRTPVDQPLFDSDKLGHLTESTARLLLARVCHILDVEFWSPDTLDDLLDALLPHVGRDEPAEEGSVAVG